jgi:ribokinase
VTAGAEGATPGQRSEIPAHKVEVDSTHGAGDCFVGSLAAFLAGGDDIEAAAQRANDAAARRVASAADTADILSMPD